MVYLNPMKNNTQNCLLDLLSDTAQLFALYQEKLDYLASNWLPDSPEYKSGMITAKIYLEEAIKGADKAKNFLEEEITRLTHV